VKSYYESGSIRTRGMTGREMERRDGRGKIERKRILASYEWGSSAHLLHSN
jgi:hypothetical protein